MSTATYKCRCSYPYGPHTIPSLLANRVNPPEPPPVHIVCDGVEVTGELRDKLADILTAPQDREGGA